MGSSGSTLRGLPDDPDLQLLCGPKPLSLSERSACYASLRTKASEIYKLNIIDTPPDLADALLYPHGYTLAANNPHTGNLVDFTYHCMQDKFRCFSLLFLVRSLWKIIIQLSPNEHIFRQQITHISFPKDVVACISECLIFADVYQPTDADVVPPLAFKPSPTDQYREEIISFAIVLCGTQLIFQSEYPFLAAFMELPLEASLTDVLCVRYLTYALGAVIGGQKRAAILQRLGIRAPPLLPSDYTNNSSGLPATRPRSLSADERPASTADTPSRHRSSSSAASFSTTTIGNGSVAPAPANSQSSPSSSSSSSGLEIAKSLQEQSYRLSQGVFGMIRWIITFGASNFTAEPSYRPRSYSIAPPASSQSAPPPAVPPFVMTFLEELAAWRGARSISFLLILLLNRKGPQQATNPFWSFLHRSTSVDNAEDLDMFRSVYTECAIRVGKFDLAALLLYSFLQISRPFGEFFFSRTDLESLFLPLLEKLYRMTLERYEPAPSAQNRSDETGTTAKSEGLVNAALRRLSLPLNLLRPTSGNNASSSGSADNLAARLHQYCVLDFVDPFPPRSLYLYLILMLLASQDGALCSHLFSSNVRQARWIREASLRDVNIGSIAVIVLCRMVSVASEYEDAYLITNSLATLANMASKMNGLHPAACKSLFHVLHLCMQNVAAVQEKDGLVSRQASTEPPSPGGGGVSLEKRRSVSLDVLSEAASSASRSAIEVHGIESEMDHLRMILETFNAVFTHALPRNLDLVHAILTHEQLLHRLTQSTLFAELVGNLVNVFRFFNSAVRSLSLPLNSANDVMYALKVAVRQWRPKETVKLLSPPRYRYEEDENSAVFFGPCVWNMTIFTLGMPWDPRCTRLLLDTTDERPTDRQPEQPAESVQPGSAPLATVEHV